MNNVQRWSAVFHRPSYSCFILLLLGSQLLWAFLSTAYDPVSTTQTLSKTLVATQRGAMTEILESKPFGSQFANVYFSIFALFCFKLFVKISLNILTHFYVVKGNRKEAARIAAEFYDFGQGHTLLCAASRSAFLCYRVQLETEHPVKTTNQPISARAGSTEARLREIADIQTCLKFHAMSYTFDYGWLDVPWGDGDLGSWADRSPLHEAAAQGRLLSLRTLLSQGYSANILTIDHVTPLHEACLGDHVACARALINAGANVNGTTIDGEALLEHGAKPQSEICQPSPIHEATSKGRSACVEALIAWGANVDYDIPHLGTPLYIACMSQQLQCTRVLLAGG
ncbi:hypothetical protein SKAU_G00392110 [Synaphobranchus kaupii]|uniref:Uncharacterized protein n=1 Tax=Synaphobranchus kaupii TaxID=118154 RepID=A0A9Q1EBN5_SYNKA|nr:hypothetical protein SKAU_G00392110 [Synaphobranchus kaupii]